MAWDERGRLWIAESHRLSEQPQAAGQGQRPHQSSARTPRATGKADKFTVFADKLSIPTGFTFANGGLIVFEAPRHALPEGHRRRRQGRRAQGAVRRLGHGRHACRPQQPAIRALTTGSGACVGYSGFDGTVGGERINSARASSVQAGRLEDRVPPQHEQQHLGPGHQRRRPGLRLDRQRLPQRLLADPQSLLRSRCAAGRRAVLSRSPTANRFFPITDKVRQVDWHGGFTAGGGTRPLHRSDLSEGYWNRTAFVTEPTGHLVATFAPRTQRAAISASNDTWNLLASDDEWTSPIMAEVGPDGNVWIIDWYSYIVQHNPTPAGFKTGKGDAYDTDLRDKTHGRIYRIVCEEGWGQGRRGEGEGSGRCSPRGRPASSSWRGSSMKYVREHAQACLLRATEATWRSRRTEVRTALR